jgi:hypothetical protein
MTLIDASKDKLFYKMNNLARKNWKLDSFDREQSGKFIEDEVELEKIGREIFDNFDLKKLDIKLFADVCSAPGMYSKILLDEFNKTIGIGISLPVEEGGVPFSLNNSRYKIFYKNILDKNYKLELNEEKNLKLDFGLASCVSYVYDSKNAYFLNMELIIKSLMLILPNLKKGGSLIINLTMKNINLAFNIVNILSKLFDNYKIWKSKTVWNTKNSFYFFGYGFNENYNVDNFNELVESIKYKHSPVNNNFMGTENEYQQIYKQMRNIYIIKLDAWNELIRRNVSKNKIGFNSVISN